MDPASAIIGIVSFGFTVFRKVNEVRKAIKAAPGQLEALQDSCDVIEMFLNRLKTMQVGLLKLAALDDSRSMEQAHLESLCRKAKRCLEEVDGALDRVVVRGAASPGVRTLSSIKRAMEGQTIRKIRWIMRKDDLEEISRKIRELRDALNVMLDFMHSNYLEVIAINVVTGNTPSQSSGSSTCVQLLPTPEPSQSSGSNPIYSESLRCLSNCTCRCHATALRMLLPPAFTSYIGQIYIPKRLLHAPWSSWSLCNVQTCRGDWQKAMSIVWLLPPTGLLLGLLSIVVNFALPLPLPGVLEAPRINISIIGTRRAIHWSAPIWDAIRRADLGCVRTLLAMRKASVWDTDLEGWPVFAFACYMWQHRPSGEGLQIIRYLVDAGAEAVLFAETPTYYSAHDWLVLGLFKCLLDSCDDDTECLSKPNSKTHSIAALLQTNTLAIDVFRSILNMDVLDALEDYLSRSPPPPTQSGSTVQERHSTDIGNNYSGHATGDTTEGTQWQQMLKSLRTRPATTRECKSVFETLLGMSPLRYAIDFSPSHVIPLLSPISSSPDNEVVNVNPDVKEPLLVFAIGAGHVHLIKPLIQAGVDVNQRYLATGETVLHIICRRCYYASFKELTRWAGHKVDWAVKTLKGENALEAFEWGISAGRGCGLQVEEVDEWREVLKERVKQGVSDTCWKEESGRMPGAFSSEGWL